MREGGVGGMRWGRDEGGREGSSEGGRVRGLHLSRLTSSSVETSSLLRSSTSGSYGT